MSFDERRSPRAQIRDWLVHANQANGASQDISVTEQDHVIGKVISKERHKQKHKGTSPRAEPRTHKRHKSHQALVPHDPSGRLANTTRPDHDGKNLAERLGLHAPFCAFEDEKHKTGLDGLSRSGRRKRRRSTSSDGSYLKPAVANDFPSSKDDRHRYSEQLGVRAGYQDLDDGESDASPRLSGSSSTTMISPEKPAKTYERRSRHKTREDRYEVKQGKTHKEENKQELKKKNKKQGKRKRKEKSGAALMSSFSAKNIARDRLTLRPVAAVGLFGKGRASSPIRRRGLPDLAFSELTFLNNRRERQEDSSDLPKKNRRKQDKDADRDAGISRYFRSGVLTEPDIISLQKRRLVAAESPRHSNPIAGVKDIDSLAKPDRSSLPPSVDLPGRPFLGFGNRGVDPSSPIKIPEVSGSSHRKLHQQPSRVDSRSSTSYFTWSRSGVPSRSTIHREQDRPIEKRPVEKSVAKGEIPATLDVDYINTSESGVVKAASVSHMAVNSIRKSKDTCPRSTEATHTAKRNDVLNPGKDIRRVQTDIGVSAPQEIVSERRALASVPQNEEPIAKPAATESDREQKLNLSRLIPDKTSQQNPLDPLDTALEALMQRCRQQIRMPAIEPSYKATMYGESEPRDPRKVGQPRQLSAHDNSNQKPSIILARSINSTISSDSRSRYNINNHPLMVPSVPSNPCPPRQAAEPYFDYPGELPRPATVESTMTHPHASLPRSACTSSAWNGYTTIYEQHYQTQIPQSNDGYEDVQQESNMTLGSAKVATVLEAEDVEFGKELSSPKSFRDYDPRPLDLYEDYDTRNEEYADNDRNEEARQGKWVDLIHDSESVYALDRKSRDSHTESLDHQQMCDVDVVRKRLTPSERGYVKSPDVCIPDHYDMPKHNSAIPAHSGHHVHNIGSNLACCVQENRTEEVEDSSMLGFWKPHKLY